MNHCSLLLTVRSFYRLLPEYKILSLQFLILHLLLLIRCSPGDSPLIRLARELPSTTRPVLIRPQSRLRRRPILKASWSRLLVQRPRCQHSSSWTLLSKHILGSGRLLLPFVAIQISPVLTFNSGQRLHCLTHLVWLICVRISRRTMTISGTA